MALKRSAPLKRGKPLKANKPLQRGGPIKRKRPLELVRGEPPKEKKPKKKGKSGAVYGRYHRWCKTLPCILKGHPLHVCIGISTAHHLHRVGNGGKDHRNEVPCCQALHDEMHWSEVDVEAKYGVNLQQIAEWIGDHLWPTKGQIEPAEIVFPWLEKWAA